jgi:hypothetical protein
MHFCAEPLLGIDRIIVNEHHMRGDDFREILKLADHPGDMLMERCGEPEVTGTEMDLHGSR